MDDAGHSVSILPSTPSITAPPHGASPTDLTLWLCRIASPIGEEQQLCDTVLARAEHEWELPQAPTRVLNSIVVPLTQGTGSCRVALVGHLDTVRTQHDGPPRIEGDRLYGCGAADMKSGLALMIAVAEDRALRAKLAGHVDLTLVFYSREEGPYAENELGPLLDAVPDLSRQNLAICLEPSNGKLQLGCMGSLHARVRFVGRTAHSARPWQGENAVHKAWPVLKELSELATEAVEIDGMRYRGVMSATLAQGGRGRNVIPDEFVLNINHRFVPGRTPAEAEARVRALVGDRAEVEIVDRSPSALPYRAHPLVDRLVSAGASAVEPKQAWTDVARFSERGVAAVNWGPGDQQQAHQRNESTSIQALGEGLEVLRRFLVSLAAHP